MIDTSTSAHYVGDCRELLAQLPDACVQTCVTSPPYWGLRDYGHAGQLGLEPTPDLYVAAMVEVFRDVRRALRDDGTLWVNLGDSYASTPSGGTGVSGSTLGGSKESQTEFRKSTKHRNVPVGLKQKDLVGIPWMVAFALRAPYYTGRIRDERDRIWLAAMLDAEGCIFIHRRKAGQSNGQGYVRQADNYAPGVEICNTSSALVERIKSLVGAGSICVVEAGKHRRKQTLYRWNLRTTECKDFVREIYPYLVAKRQQARIAFGCPPSGDLASAAHAALIGLHHGRATDIDFPPPPNPTEPGWYLRSDIIWSKSNPMPESVRDRPTKAHEYLFLLSKSESYYYESGAASERAVSVKPSGNGYKRPENVTRANPDGTPRGGDEPWKPGPGKTRNARSVWTVATQPYSGAHFATFPPRLIEPCILAGCPVGGLVLDPFHGSGTTGMVAQQHGRRWIGFDLGYADLVEERMRRPMLPMRGVR